MLFVKSQGPLRISRRMMLGFFDKKFKILSTLQILTAMLLSLSLCACSDDLTPSDVDKRTNAGATSENFSVTDNQGNTIALADELNDHEAVLLYFTMWCPVCDTHMSSIRENIKPAFENVRYIMIDYVSANDTQSFNTQAAFGYRSEIVVADASHELLDQFEGGMGKTVIVHQDMTILLNEDYKESRVRQVLNSLSNDVD